MNQLYHLFNEVEQMTIRWTGFSWICELARTLCTWIVERYMVRTYRPVDVTAIQRNKESCRILNDKRSSDVENCGRWVSIVEMVVDTSVAKHTLHGVVLCKYGVRCMWKYREHRVWERTFGGWYGAVKRVRLSLYTMGYGIVCEWVQLGATLRAVTAAVNIANTRRASIVPNTREEKRNCSPHSHSRYFFFIPPENSAPFNVIVWYTRFKPLPLLFLSLRAPRISNRYRYTPYATKHVGIYVIVRWRVHWDSRFVQ